jgi:hypothetical protein
MERPKSHITDSMGEAQMRAIFESVGWAVNRIVNDYGVDFDIQIFEDNKATGEWFKVQLKSSESSQYSANRTFLSQPLSADHATHYSKEMRDPIFLIHADVKDKKTFWFAPQLTTLAKASEYRESVSFRIDTCSELPATLPQMVIALRQIRLKLGARIVSESPITDFANSVEVEDRETAIQGLQDRTDFLRIRTIHDEVSEGDLEESKDRLEAVISNQHSSVEIKVAAVLEEERIEFMAAHRSETPQSAISQIRLQIGKRFQLLTKDGPPALKFFALLARKAGELDVLTFQDFGLFMNWMGHVKSDEGNPFIALHLAMERLKSTGRIIRKYNQCVRLARYAANSKYRWALPNALLRVVQSMAIFIMRLRTEGQEETARQYRNSAMQFCRLAVWIADQNDDDESLSFAMTAAFLLTGRGDKADLEQEEVLSLAREALSKIKDSKQAELTKEAFDRGMKRIAGASVEGDPKPDLVRQIIENRAAGLGIDMTDSEDLTVKLIRLGIKDISPERAIKHCRHAFVSISGRVPLSVSTLAELLQLPSINGKIIHCDLHEYAVESRTLDIAAEHFRKKYCETCKDISPRPSDWEYSDEWQAEENARHSDFMMRFYAGS